MAGTTISSAHEIQPQTTSIQAGWGGWRRIAFRFVFSYFCLYCLDCAAILTYFLISNLGSRHGFFFMDYVWRGIVPWVAKHLLRIQKQISSNGSDGTFGYVSIFTEILLALIATVVWSLWDRKRTEYRRLFHWLRLVVLLLLAGMLFSYGFDKAFPLQFGTLTPSKLATRLGDMSPFDVLWNFMAASTAYTIFSGVIEILGGVLLLIPRTRAIGAMVSFAALANVWVLNMTYDVPVKILSFHLMLMSLLVLAPELPDLTNLLVLRRAVIPAIPPQLSDRKIINQGAAIVFAAVGLFFFVTPLWGSWHAYTRRASAAKPPFYGVWEIDELKMTGSPNGSLFTDKVKTSLRLGAGEDRWARLVFEVPHRLVIQTPSGAADDVTLEFTDNNTSMSLSDQDWDPGWAAHLKIDKPGADTLNLLGTVNGMEVSAKLHRLPESNFRLIQSRFHFTTD